MTPIPEDTLRAVYRREQPYRYHWPASYDEGMGDPIISRIVELLARHQVPAFGRRRADRARVGLDAHARPCACFNPSAMTDEQCARAKADGNVVCLRKNYGVIYAQSPSPPSLQDRSLSNKDRAAGEREDCKVCNGTGIDPKYCNFPIQAGKTYPACESCNGTGYK